MHPGEAAPILLRLSNLKLNFAVLLKLERKYLETTALLRDYPGNINKFVILFQYKTEYMSYSISPAQNSDNHNILSISIEEVGSLAYMTTIQEMRGMHSPGWTNTSLQLEILL